MLHKPGPSDLNSCLHMCTLFPMRSLGQILGASSRMDVLRALYYQQAEVGLRQLARLAGIHPHSAERFLKQLIKERLVICRRSEGHTWYCKNSDHTDWLVLEAILIAGDRATRTTQRATLNQRAQSILPFIQEAHEMVSQARSTAGVA